MKRLNLDFRTFLGSILGIAMLVAGMLSGCASVDRKVAAEAEGPCKQTIEGKPVQGGIFCPGSASFEGHMNRVH